MDIKLVEAENNLIVAVHNMPAVSIILPFEPKMSLKSELNYSLKIAMEKVEKELMENYPGEKAIPVIQKLHELLQNLNYNTHKKSIAIFASPYIEKTFYLDLAVEEKIVIDESFEIRDLVYCKKQNIKYLILLLSANKSKMFLGNSSSFMLIKSNVSFSSNRDVPERVANFSDPDNLKEVQLKKFLHDMDEGLSIVLKAYPLPVFILGPEKVLGYFEKISKNVKSIVGLHHGNYDEASEPEMIKVLEPDINNWRKVKEDDLMHQVEKAIDAKKVVFGIKDVWDTATHKNGKLLIVEKDFIYPARQGKNPATIYKEDPSLNKAFYIKDAVDDVMEKILDNGGDVEFVDNDVLKEYGRIVLIQYY